MYVGGDPYVAIMSMSLSRHIKRGLGFGLAVFVKFVSGTRRKVPQAKQMLNRGFRVCDTMETSAACNDRMYRLRTGLSLDSNYDP